MSLTFWNLFLIWVSVSRRPPSSLVIDLNLYFSYSAKCCMQNSSIGSVKSNTSTFFFKNLCKRGDFKILSSESPGKKKIESWPEIILEMYSSRDVNSLPLFVDLNLNDKLKLKGNKDQIKGSNIRKHASWWVHTKNKYFLLF